MQTKTPKVKAANDNRHDPFSWDFLHKYLDLWFDHNKIPMTKDNHNRVLHYTYELQNRPWMDKIARNDETKQWLCSEAARFNVGFF